MYTTIDDLETEYGTAILSELCGQPLTRNQQPVRLSDQTQHSAEFFYRADEQGKPYIQNFQTGTRKYPVTAYAEFCGVDFATAKTDLIRQYYGDAMPDSIRSRPRRIEQPVSLPVQVDYVPTDYYERCRSHFERNGLYEYLRFTYGLEKANEVFARYRLGTSRKWQHFGYLATCLPQFDIAGNLRQVKVMPFDAMNGRRVKKHQAAEQWNPKTSQYGPTAPDSDKTYFAGKQLLKDAGITDVYLKQCFFGEHLLSDYPGLSVAVVEGESTAIVCSIIWPQFIWLATGGSNGAGWTKPETFRVLRGRNVTLWPDTGKFADWSQKAELLRPLVLSLNVSDYVEKNAPISMGNVDLRDLLTRPCYFPSDGSPPIYGEVLPVDLCDFYPPEWDAPNPPDAVPTIRAQTVYEWQNDQIHNQ